MFFKDFLRTVENKKSATVSNLLVWWIDRFRTYPMCSGVRGVVQWCAMLLICRIFHHQVLGSRWIDEITMSMLL